LRKKYCIVKPSSEYLSPAQFSALWTLLPPAGAQEAGCRATLALIVVPQCILLAVVQMLSLSLTIQLAFQQHLHLLHLEELPCIENELQQLVERQVTATCKCWGDGVSPSRRYSCTYSDDRCRCSRVSTSCVSKTCCWGEVSQRSFAGLATSVWLVGELMSLSACWPATTQTILDARERPKISNFVGFLSKHCWMAECTELVYGWGCAWSGLHYIRSDL